MEPAQLAVRPLAVPIWGSNHPMRECKHPLSMNPPRSWSDSPASFSSKVPHRPVQQHIFVPPSPSCNLASGSRHSLNLHTHSHTHTLPQPGLLTLTNRKHRRIDPSETHKPSKMKTSAVLAALALAVATNAQTAGDLPKCAQDCANQFLLSGIGNCGRDPKCICSNQSFISDISCCLAKPGGCGADDQKKAITFAAQLCQANGVTVPNEVVCNSNNNNNNNNGTTTGGGSGGSSTTSGTTPAVTSSSRAWAAPRQTGAAAVGLLGGLAAAAVLL
ncbi:hypothetical protein RB600_009504 [Gaeumannomyces tritici]